MVVRLGRDMGEVEVRCLGLKWEKFRFRFGMEGSACTDKNIIVEASIAESGYDSQGQDNHTSGLSVEPSRTVISPVLP